MEDKNENFKPYVPADQNPSELTVRSVVVGVLLLLVFGMANAYLGLEIGMTVSASIPAAVVSMAIMRGLMKKTSILENNMAQSIVSAGESLAAGVVLSLLNTAYTIGSEAMPSLATAVISVLVEGIFSGNLPWGLLLIGAALGLMAELVGVPALPFAIGIYLLISLTVPIFIGGAIHALLEKQGFENEGGILYASGLVAGDSIVGVLGAALAVGGISLGFGAGLLSETVGNIVCLAAFAAMAVSVYTTARKSNKK